MGWPHSEQCSSTWLIWPQAWCRYSTGGPASPASHLSPHTTITMSTSKSSSPLAVRTDVLTEDTQELSHPDALDLLATETLLRLAYTGPDGFPRVIPIGFHWTGENIVVCTVPSSPKARALAVRPHVALTIDTNQGTPGRSLSVRGVAAIEIVDGVPDEYLAASTKTMEADQARQFEAAVRSLYKQMARINIQPQWARCYDFGAGRVPGFLLKLKADCGTSPVPPATD